jgi:thioredoxin-like negative regulator of GroEL
MIASHSIPLLTTLTFDDYARHSSRPLLVAVSTSVKSEDQELLCLLAEMIPHGDGRMAVVRISAEDCPELVQRLRGVAAPALILYSDGEVRYQYVGQMCRRELADFLARLSGGLRLQRPEKGAAPLPTQNRNREPVMD